MRPGARYNDAEPNLNSVITGFKVISGSTLGYTATGNTPSDKLLIKRVSDLASVSFELPTLVTYGAVNNIGV
jgi:hypothetical protein